MLLDLQTLPFVRGTLPRKPFDGFASLPLALREPLLDLHTSQPSPDAVPPCTA